MKTIIVGGVAGGMSAATRLRRLMPDAEIAVLERGEHVSYANCGLPYHLGGVIDDREELLLQTPQSLHTRFGLDVRVRSEVLRIDRDRHTVRVRDLRRPGVHELLRPAGALPRRRPVVPDLPGIERALSLRDVDDVDRIVARRSTPRPRTAVVIGGGFIGLELAENLVAPRTRGHRRRGRRPGDGPPRPRDGRPGPRPSCAARASRLLLGAARDQDRRRSRDARRRRDASRPTSSSRRSACGPTRPGRRRGPCDRRRAAASPSTPLPHQRPATSTPSATPSRSPTRSTARRRSIPLANTANRQGRLAADVIAGQPGTDRPVLGTAIVGVFGLQVADDRLEREAARAAGPPRTARSTPTRRRTPATTPAPRACRSSCSSTPPTDAILGAQGVGRDGVDKRIDVHRHRHQRRADRAGRSPTSSSPTRRQFGSAKDPVNMLGYVADNLRTGTGAGRSSGTSSRRRSPPEPRRRRPHRRRSTPPAPSPAR